MADKEINDLKEENVYLAHVDYETQRIQVQISDKRSPFLASAV